LPKIPRGLIVPLITPFKKDLSVDFEGLRWLLSKLVESGVDGVFPSSSTGEFVHMTLEEIKEVNKFTVECVGGRVSVLAGATANSTDHVLDIARAARDSGADGIIVTTPFYFKHSQETLWKHFSIIAEKSDIPVVLYNNPGMTGVVIPPDLVAKLAEEYSNVVGIKVTYDDVKYFMKVIDSVKNLRRDFSVLTGSAYMLLTALALGGDGAVAAIGNAYPKTLREVYTRWLDGDRGGAAAAFERVLELSRLYYLHDNIGATIKKLLHLSGAPIEPYVRPPLTPPKDEVISEFLRKYPVEMSLE